ncbi:MAG: hypothetical protein ACYTEU_13515 [Planctomycetota bacterium]
MRTIALFVGLMGCLFVLGCASGRYPEPVLSYMPGDGAMSCEELHIEMAKVKQEMMLKPTKIQIRDGRNNELAIAGGAMGAAAGTGAAAAAGCAAAGATGFAFIWPWGEIDNLKAEEVELDALRMRYNNLFMIAVNKGCLLGNNTIAVKKKGGRDVTLDDVLDDELPPRFQSIAALRQ